MNCVEAIRRRLSARGSVLRVPEGLGKQVSAKRRGASPRGVRRRTARRTWRVRPWSRQSRSICGCPAVCGVSLEGANLKRHKRAVTHLCSVNDLVGDDNVARADLFLEAAYGREGDDGLDAEVLQGGNVGAGGDFGGRNRVVEAVAGEERERDFASRGLERGDGDG